MNKEMLEQKEMLSIQWYVCKEAVIAIVIIGLLAIGLNILHSTNALVPILAVYIVVNRSKLAYDSYQDRYSDRALMEVVASLQSVVESVQASKGKKDE